MPEMSPEEISAMQEQAGGGGPEGGGDITKLLQQGGEILARISDVVGNSGAATDQDREQFAGIMNSYIDFVENKLGGAGPGEDVPEEEPPGGMGAVSAMGGAKGVPMGPQSRM